MTNLLDRPDDPPAMKWQTRTIGDLSELAQARAEAINVAQWLARIANKEESVSAVTGSAVKRSSVRSVPR